MAARSSNRQPRLYVVSFNGTWAGGVLSSHKTVVSEFVGLLADHENVVELPINGVGSDISIVDRVLGGLSGWGTLRNVVIAMRNIAKQYKPGDRIMLLGYSRGAWAARYLATLIDMLGLPKHADEEFFEAVYRAHNNSFTLRLDKDAPWLVKHERWHDVRIAALCCFDTVRSLGMPLTGLARPLAFLKGARRHNHDIVSDVPGNVDIAFHCLSLHETRAPYHPTFMRGPNVHQVLFPGTHRDLGWIDSKESLVHAPFAWLIQQLHTHLGLSFDNARLAARFPSYCRLEANTSTTGLLVHESSQAPTTTTPPAAANELPKWCQEPLRTHSAALLAVIGKKGRGGSSRKTAGRSSSTGVSDLAGVQVHIGARLRAQVDDVDTVPNFTLMAPMVGKPFWVRRQPSQSAKRWARASSSSSSSSSSRDTSASAMANRPATANVDKAVQRHDSSSAESNQAAGRRSAAPWGLATTRMDEAPVGLLEAQLLGLPVEVVAR